MRFHRAEVNCSPVFRRCWQLWTYNVLRQNGSGLICSFKEHMGHFLPGLGSTPRGQWIWVCMELAFLSVSLPRGCILEQQLECDTWVDTAVLIKGRARLRNKEESFAECDIPRSQIICDSCTREEPATLITLSTWWGRGGWAWLDAWSKEGKIT